MSEFTLRDYQREALGAIKSALQRKDNALLVAPCGSGKTVIFGQIVKWLHEAGRRTLVLLDRETLVAQSYYALRAQVDEGISVACAALKRKDLSGNVVVGSRQTIAPMMRNGHKDASFNLVILDECHVAAPRGQYADILKQLRANYPAMRVLGVTATPHRMFGGPIYGKTKSFFEEIDFKIPVSELLEQGYLCPLVWKVRKSDLLAQLDLIEKSPTGEIDEAKQAEVLGQEKFVRGVYDIYRQYAGERKTAIFCLTIKHAEAVQEVFKSKGIPSWIVHSKLRAQDVRTRIKAFSEGSGVIVNVGQLTTGVDIPSISCIILARRTLSSTLFVQIVGRAARVFPGKTDALILDLCGSTLIFGTDLDNPITSQADDKDSPPPVKICPMCERATSIQTRTCPECGFKFPVAEIEEFEKQQALRDAGDPGELVDAVPFIVERAEHIKYVKHRVGAGEAVCAFYYGAPPLGKYIGRQYLFTDYRFGKRNVDNSRYHWFNLGGKHPAPKNPGEWIARANELTSRVNVTLDVSGKNAVVKKVEGVSEGEKWGSKAS